MTHTTATAGKVEKDTKIIMINNDHSAVAEAKQDNGNDTHNCHSRQGRET